ncbi:MAG: GNAT family N-acetyltransferase [Novosphingobium sp.]|nr:GNAT family N-acetyltransferase [Novosphingobium sp.]
MKIERISKPANAAVEVAQGDDALLDAVASAADPAHAFLRSQWLRAGGGDIDIIAASRQDGTPLAAIALTRRRFGPIALGEVAGPYWPFRSFALAADIRDEELLAFLSDPAARKFFGRAWRLGPAYSGDPTADRLVLLAEAAGWKVLERDLGSVFELDLAALRAQGEWPRAKTLRKNRWRERRLGEIGEIEYCSFTGSDWASRHRDAMAEVEQASWLADLEDGSDTKFADPACRAIWESAAQDPVLAPMLFGSVMSIGGEAAAFTFGLESGATRYYIANNYNEKFGRFGPGKILLYRDFADCADRGITRISWGAGDAGYKSEMGATAGPAIRDLLFVRGAGTAAVLRPLFERAG